MLESTAVMDSLAEKFDDDDHQNDENGHADQQSGDSHWAHCHDCFPDDHLSPGPAGWMQSWSKACIVANRFARAAGIQGRLRAICTPYHRYRLTIGSWKDS